MDVMNKGRKQGFNITAMGLGVAQYFRTLASLAEDPSFVLRTHQVSHNPL